MNIVALEIPDILLVTPRIFVDDRGFFFESYNQRELAAGGVTASFVQDNQSRSESNVLRGLHYQVRQPQGKLVRVAAGEVFDVAVDLRRTSVTFGKWVSARLSAENKHMLWIPPGFAHGFLVIRGPADFLYKTTDYWKAEAERTILWNDAELNIQWPLQGKPILSGRDAQGARFCEAEYF